MKAIRLCRAAMVTAVCAAASSAWAGVMDLVPDNAVAVVRIANLKATNEKLANFLGDQGLGLTVFQPKLKDPLGSLTEKLNIKEGLDQSGEFAIVIQAIEGASPNESTVMLVPVSNYEAAVANIEGAKADGALTMFETPDGETLYVANWGSHAAIAENKALIEAKPAKFVKLPAKLLKQVDGYDISVLAMPSTIREDAAAHLDELEQKIADELPTGQMPFDAKVIEVLMKQGVNVMRTFLNDADYAHLGVNLLESGVRFNVAADFREGSYLGNLAAGMKSTDKPLLRAIPDANYIVYGGGTFDPEIGQKLFDDFTGPIVAAMADAEKPLPGLDAETLSVARDVLGTLRGGSFGYVSPASLPSGSLTEMLIVLDGDPAVLKSATSRTIEIAGKNIARAKAAVEAGTFDAMTAGNLMAMELTEDAREVGGIKFSQFVTRPADINDPAYQQQVQMMAFLGVGRQTAYIGYTDAGQLQFSGGLDEATVNGFVEAYKSGATPMADSANIQAVAAHLPKSRINEIYIQPDEIIATAVGFAGRFGFPLDVTTPTDLEPIGIATATDGTSISVTTYVPTRTVQAAIVSGVQIFQQVQQMFGGARNNGGL